MESTQHQGKVRRNKQKTDILNGRCHCCGFFLADLMDAFPFGINNIHPQQTTQNMFQEGLYQVFFKDTRPSNPASLDSSGNGELNNARIHRWFGSVVNTRLVVAGVSRCPLFWFTVTDYILKTSVRFSFLPFFPF